MPDWMSHILVGLIIAEAFNIRKKSLVLLGALLPDVLSKLFLLFFYFDFFNNLSVRSFHSPIMVFLLAILLAPIFKYNRLKTVILVSVGALSHFLADLTMRHFNSGIRLLFPFSMETYSLGLLWPDESIYFLLGALIVYLALKLCKKYMMTNTNLYK